MNAMLELVKTLGKELEKEPLIDTWDVDWVTEKDPRFSVTLYLTPEQVSNLLNDIFNRKMGL